MREARLSEKISASVLINAAEFYAQSAALVARLKGTTPPAEEGITPPVEHWISHRDALDMIMRKRNAGPKAAQEFLAKACSRKVRLRYLAFWEGPTVTTQNPYRDRFLADLDDKSRNALGVRVGTKLVDPLRLRMECRVIGPGKWAGSSIDFATGTYRTDDVEFHVEVNANDLSKQLTRPSRGPKPGTTGYDNRPLLNEMAALLADGKASSATDALRKLVKAGHEISGRGGEESRIKRVVKEYGKAYPTETY
jgi:hypothetical protein